MKCTQCSAPVRPVVAVDIDGTLGDYHGHLTEFIADYYGKSVPSWDDRYKGDETMRDWACRTFGIGAADYRGCKLAYRQGGGKRTMPVYSGAAGLCATVVEAGAELWLTTTRPYLRLDSTDPDTRHWLERHSIPFHHLLYDDDKYRQLAQIVDRDRVVAVLDDLPDLLLQAGAVFGHGVPLMRMNPYNDRAKWGGHMTPSLHAAERSILERVRRWKETHT